MYLFESKKNYEVAFNYKGKSEYYSSNVFRKVYTDTINWLYDNGYKFDERVRGRELINSDEVPTNYEGHGVHYIPNTNYAILVNFGIPQSIRYLRVMLERFGATDIDIKTSEQPSIIKKFGEIDTDVEDFDLDEDDLTPVEEPVDKIKVYKQNPFKQSICVLGESGAGKSVTIETILENEGHNFEFIIPTAATTGLLAQFSPSKSGYVPSRLGKMFIESSKNPQKLYTAVFDEMHKSNVIEMINDELLQAISTKRNRGRRFISLDDDTAEIYSTSELETERGNLIIPENFGFIFISSKPKVIANNPDFFNRVDIVILKSYEEQKVNNSQELLSLLISDIEKKKLVSSRND